MRRPEKNVVEEEEEEGVTPLLSSLPYGAVLGLVEDESALPTPSPRNPLVEMHGYASDRTGAVGAVGAVVEKRGLDLNPANLQEISPDPKRRRVPALANVIIEAVKVDSLQKICSSIEPILRRVVSEELERALAKLGPATIAGRSSPPRIEGPDGRNLQLQFRTRLSLPLFTGGKVEGEQGAAIHVVLLDASTGHLVTSGPESSSKLDVVVLEGDFSKEDGENWSEEEFESNVVKEREGKRPLLTGDMQVSLKEGVGTLGDLTFTDNSSWIRSRKFRLGLKIACGFCEGIRIREGKTEAFTVKDHRGELYKKHYPPALTDEVWRLEKIGKDGSFHKKLIKAGIRTVEDFLKMVVRNQQELRNILGSSMSNKMWEVLVEHAKTCVLSDKLYVYYSDEARNVGVIFNHIYEFCGLITDDQYHPAEELLDNQKVFVDSLVKKAYDNWAHVVVYDGKTFFNSIGNGISASDTNYPSNNQQLSVPRSMNSLPSTHGAIMVSDLNYRDNIGCGDQITRYSDQHCQINLGDASYAPQNDLAVVHQHQFTRNNSTGLLALDRPGPSNLEFQPVVSSMPPSQLHPCDVFYTEDEIRVRSHELLGHADMQEQLFHVLTTMGGTSNVGNDGYTFPSYMPTPVLNETRHRSGKAVVGWLKIKAAMRWGIFVRKIAAERRARLVELDD